MGFLLQTYSLCGCFFQANRKLKENIWADCNYHLHGFVQENENELSKMIFFLTLHHCTLAVFNPCYSAAKEQQPVACIQTSPAWKHIAEDVATGQQLPKLITCRFVGSACCRHTKTHPVYLFLRCNFNPAISIFSGEKVWSGNILLCFSDISAHLPTVFGLKHSSHVPGMNALVKSTRFFALRQRFLL